LYFFVRTTQIVESIGYSRLEKLSNVSLQSRDKFEEHKTGNYSIQKRASE